MQAPRIEKITLNMGVGLAKQDSKMLKAATEQLATIAGQQPSVRRARKSIAAFKLREGMPVGVAVTLRAERGYEFLDRLISIAIPRIRDFRGLNPRSFDGRGNYSMGVKEQIIFPEIDYDAIDQVRGLDITITTSAASDIEAYALLAAFGMPFSRRAGPRATTPTPTAPRARTRRPQAASAAAAAEGRGSRAEAAQAEAEAAEPRPPKTAAEAAAERSRRRRSRAGGREPEAAAEPEPEAEASRRPRRLWPRRLQPKLPWPRRPRRRSRPPRLRRPASRSRGRRGAAGRQPAPRTRAAPRRRGRADHREGEHRLMAKTSQRVKQARTPKFKTRAYTRCTRCGRPRAVYRKFGICRICLRDLAHNGQIPGMTKSSW